MWGPIKSSDGTAEAALLYTRFSRLQVTSRGLAMRESLVDSYLEMLDADLRSLQAACSAHPSGEDLWLQVVERLQELQTLGPGMAISRPN